MLLSMRRPAAAVALALLAALLVTVAPGGRAAAEPVGEVDGVQVERFGGPNRIDTAVEVSQEVFETATAVVVARADTYADALVGAPLAAALDAPILLNAVDEVSPQVTAELERLGATEVLLLGGTEALTADVESAFAADYDVTRVDGGNRFDTAAGIARQLYETSTARPEVETGTVFVALGGAETITAGFPDPLSAGYYAAFLEAPVLLTAGPDLAPETVEVIDELAPTEVVIVGGEDAISADVEATLTADGAREVRRLAGDTRYETSAAVYDEAVTMGVDPATRWLATGANFPDALSAGPAVAAEGEALLLVDGDDLTAETSTASRITVSRDLLEQVNLLGLEDAISDDALAQLEELLTVDLAAAEYCLTLLHNNDGESQLLPDGDLGGIARFGSVVDRERARALEGTPDDGCSERAVLTLNSGDNYLAGPEFQASLDRREEGLPFYDTIALETIGYDAFAIGNHEFDFGPEVLADFIDGFDDDGAPFVSANLNVRAETSLAQLEDEGRIVPSTILDGGARQVGVVGLTTPDLPQVSAPESVTVSPELAEIVAEEVADLQDGGADVIVLVSHLQSIDEEINLVPALSGVDIVIGGGGDEVLATPGELLRPGDDQAVFGPYPLTPTDADGNAVPVVTTPGNYGYVGRLKARFGADGLLDGTDGVDPTLSKIVRVASTALPDGVEDDPELVAEVVEPLEDYVAGLGDEVIGESDVPLDGTRDNVRSTETNLGNLVADAQVAQVVESLAPDGPVVGLQNGGGIRNTTVIPAGPLTVLDTFDTLPFGNFTGLVEDLEPADLKLLLEQAYGSVEFGAGTFGQIAGMAVEVDLSEPGRQTDENGDEVQTGSRVQSLILDDGTPVVVGGEPVPASAATTVDLAINNFSAAGGDGYPFPDDAEFVPTGIVDRQSLERYIVEDLGGVVTAADYPVGGEGRITITE